MNLETVAEGVEDAEQREALVDLGCTHIQGYLFSPPMPANETSTYINDNGAGIGEIVSSHRR